MKILSFVLFLLTVFLGSAAFAQNVGGEWYGVGKVKKPGEHNNYLSELILKQKGNKVTGEFNYYYRSSEIKIKVSGRYDPRYRVLELNPQPMINFLAKDANGADCPMEGSFTLKIIKGVATLTGQFNPTYDYRIICPAIDVKFTKSVPKASDPVPVTANDEDTTLTVGEIKKPSAVIKTDTTKKPFTAGKPIVSNKIDTTTKPGIVTKSDTANKSGVITKPVAISKPTSTEQQISLALKLRAFDESPIIDVDADSLKVSLYDNGEVDNDTISLFYNRKLVATKQMLSDKALTFTFPLNNDVNEIAMFAENLGRIPPNTALAVIYAGEQRFELNLTSTFNKNASIRFRRKTKQVDPKNIN